MAGQAVRDDFGPDEVAVALDDRVRLALLQGLFGIQRGVNAAIDDPGAALARHLADLVAAQSVAGVDADADDVPGLNAVGIDLLQRLVDEDGIAHRRRRGRGQHEEPAGRNDGRAKGIVAGIHQKNAHRSPAFPFCCWRGLRERLAVIMLNGAGFAWTHGGYKSLARLSPIIPAWQRYWKSETVKLSQFRTWTAGWARLDDGPAAASPAFGGTSRSGECGSPASLPGRSSR